MKTGFITCRLALASLVLAAEHTALAGISLIADASISGTALDDSGLNYNLENGQAANLLGGIGSGLAYAGGNTFLALPDRGPNAVAWNSALDNTTSYVDRYQTIQLALSPSGGGPLPFNLTPALTGTTLLYSADPLTYGGAGSVPPINGANQFYFSGRSDNFGPGNSLNASDARLDPEGIRVSNDGSKVYISDEYGPYVYEFDRATGQRLKTFTLPDNLAIASLNSRGSVEISGNTSGRVANKGMEGLAITPDGKTLVGFVQSPLIQDGGDGGRANRIVTIDVASGTTHEYAYDNKIGAKNFNSSEILALNDHQFLVLERDGKGLGDGSVAATKQVWMVDLTGAQDVSSLSGEAALLAKAPSKTLFLDILSALKAAGFTTDQIPAKLEGMAFGQDVVLNGQVEHTLYIANDNDLLPADPQSGANNPNQWFVFGVSDSDLSALGATFDTQFVPDSASSTALLLAFPCAGLLFAARRQTRPVARG